MVNCCWGFNISKSLGQSLGRGVNNSKQSKSFAFMKSCGSTTQQLLNIFCPVIDQKQTTLHWTNVEELCIWIKIPSAIENHRYNELWDPKQHFQFVQSILNVCGHTVSKIQNITISQACVASCRPTNQNCNFIKLSVLFWEYFTISNLQHFNISSSDLIRRPFPAGRRARVIFLY